MIFFSLTTPTMKLAVRDFDPVVVGVGRAVIAALPAAIALLALRAPRLNFRQIKSLLLVGGCLGFGFSWLAAEAIKFVPSYHASVMIGGIPFVTALVATLRSRQRQSPLFWLASGLGSAIVIGYGLSKSGGQVTMADSLLIVAAIFCGIGYAEGARLGKEIGAFTLACWVPIVTTPGALLICMHHLPADWRAVHLTSWLALLYNGLFSVFIAFMFWYRGLAKGGTARIGQIQLAQPFLSLAAAALLLREPLSLFDWAAALGVVACVGMAQATSARASEPTTGESLIADVRSQCESRNCN